MQGRNSGFAAISIQKAYPDTSELNQHGRQRKLAPMCVLNTVDMRFLEKRQSVKKRLFSYFV